MQKNYRRLIQAFLATSMLSLGYATQGLAYPNHILMSYFTDWGVYSTSNAIAEPSYAMPGSYNSSGAVITNADLTGKLNDLNILAYAFLEVQPNGYVYFYDPYADLHLPDAFCTTGAGSSSQQNICGYAQEPATWGLGNFEAFSNLHTPNLRKIISVGGWAHDQSMLYAESNPNNFAQSVKNVVTNYGLDGIDLDYEPQTITTDEAQNFVKLAQTLRQTLGPNALITVAVRGNQQWIADFGKANWQTLAKTVNYMNVMGYDFHGAFDNPSLTNFLSNLYAAQGSPAQPVFDVDAAVQALNTAGVPSGMITVGFPAYGRATEGVANNNNGLYQPFNLIPRGDMDPATCDQSIASTSNTCNGMFTYHYIQSSMLKNGFAEHTDTANNVASGVWAYNPNNWIGQSSTPNTSTFISYDNVDAVNAKAEYVLNHHLAGMMMWEVSGDTTPQQAGGSTASLLDTALKAMSAASN